MVEKKEKTLNGVTNRPSVSIGMPTYNGSRYIQQSLDSLLAQDYKDFELVISDNASSDGTDDICRRYAKTDNRIHYYRSETNLGAIKNFNRTLDLSTGKYFMWAGDHDLWQPSFVSRCVSVLENDPTVVLAYTRTMFIGMDDSPLGITPDRIDTRGMSAIQRYKHVIWNLHWCNMIYGLIRKDALDQSGKCRNVWGADHLLLAELALKGAFAQIPDALFYRRKNRPDQDPETNRKRVVNDLDPSTAISKSEIPVESLWRETRRVHLQLVLNANVGFFERLTAIISTLACFRLRFKVGGRISLYVERIAGNVVPKRYRSKILSWLQRAY